MLGRPVSALSALPEDRQPGAATVSAPASFLHRLDDGHRRDNSAPFAQRRAALPWRR